MIRKVLFPVDFSIVSEYAFGNCIPRFFASGAANELILFHALDVVPTTGQALEAVEEMVRRYQKRIEEISKEFEEMGIKARGIVRLGTPAIEIAKVAEEEDVDLIYMPMKGENIFREMLIGSTAANVARAAKKPVLFVRYEWDRGKKAIKCYWDAKRVFEKPLIAVDFSPCSEKVIGATEVFKEFIKEAVLMHVVDYGRAEEVEENAKKAMEELKKYEEKLDFPVEVEVHSGVASKEILMTAPVNGATLIVIGKKGKSIIKELLLGSTAENVIRNSVLPVLVVPCE
ncbi:universal stress protein [Archaeoglobus veneficus]|uniref:UspA domain-containing protein n=1 Tax=Archaeoglobus veneficus (strain DSM 11195 / SNP6) TaxID=693661 RepID=F2KS38_ARCVS|nr:universal stress protein [Archaeoglobus veneficus]AEA47977.1 UspA domain-containing protein [Archaeoglobus veneficus SNP6]